MQSVNLTEKMFNDSLKSLIRRFPVMDLSFNLVKVSRFPKVARSKDFGCSDWLWLLVTSWTTTPKKKIILIENLRNSLNLQIERVVERSSIDNWYAPIRGLRKQSSVFFYPKFGRMNPWRFSREAFRATLPELSGTLAASRWRLTASLEPASTAKFRHHWRPSSWSRAWWSASGRRNDRTWPNPWLPNSK